MGPPGQPAYTLVGANGKERNTHLGDARKLDLVPSVTTITGLLDRPGLNDWRETQAMLAVMSVPRKERESDEEYLERARAESKNRGSKIRERGTLIHADIELAIQGKPHGHRAHVSAIALAMAEAGLDLYAGTPEKTFAHADGFGGKTDYWWKDVIADFKSKDRITQGRKLAWAEHALQIAAYAYGLGIENPRGFNIFVGVEDRVVVVHQWKPAELAHGLIVFKELLLLWRLLKGWTT